jgi:muramidase (phage lysozyme)
MAAADDALREFDPPATTPSSSADDVLKAVPVPKATPGPPTPLAPTITSTPGGTNEIRSAGAPSAATEAQDQAHLNVAGPVTPQLVVQAGFPAQEADGWASLANWMTAGEAHSFNTLYGGDQFTDFSAHPKDKGWSGGIGPTGKDTSAAGLFQDEQGTWHIIQQKYGLRDFSATSQVSGNLRFAAELYQQRTGRSLLADFKAGNTASISATLQDQWPSLGSGGSSGGEAADPAFRKYQEMQRAGMGDIRSKLDALLADMSKEAPGSEEQHRMMRLALQHSEDLQKRFEKLSEAPPKPMSPFEAAGELTPLLIGLVSMGGMFTRRPALGAINALGSALGALKQGNDENYKQAVDLWKSQSDLASKAFDMEAKSLEIIAKDREMTERDRQAKYQNMLRVLGLQTDLRMAEANQWKELYERNDTRQEKADKHKEAVAKAALDFARARQLDAGGSTQFGTALRANINKFVEDNGRQPDATENDQIVERTVNEVKGKGRQGTEQGYIDDALQARADEKGVPVDKLSAADKRDATRTAHEEWSQAGAAGRAEGSPEATYRKAIEAQMSAAKRARGEDGALSEAEKADAAKQAATFKHQQVGLTGNLRAHIQDEQLQYSEGLNTITDIMDLMDRHGMIAGLGGRIMRGKELIGDILGFGGSDYYDFQRKIEMLQNWANGLLQQKAAGRQLSVQENRITDIVPGLSLGQPVDRVYPAMLDLQKIFTDMFMLRDQQLKGQVPVFTPPIAAGGTGVMGAPTSAAPMAAGNAPAPSPGVTTTVAPGLSGLYPEAR